MRKTRLSQISNELAKVRMCSASTNANRRRPLTSDTAQSPVTSPTHTSTPAHEEPPVPRPADENKQVAPSQTAPHVEESPSPNQKSNQSSAISLSTDIPPLS